MGCGLVLASDADACKLRMAGDLLLDDSDSTIALDAAMGLLTDEAMAGRGRGTEADRNE